MLTHEFTGLHALELAKVLWNITCTSDPGTIGSVLTAELIKHAKSSLTIAAFILRKYGEEGDLQCPLEQIKEMAKNLSNAERDL